MSDADWPAAEPAPPAPREPERRPAPLPRLEDLPVAEQGYDREKVREAFDEFYRHAAQLDATLRTLEAVDVFQRTAAELRAELRTMRGAGWTVQSWQSGGYGSGRRVAEWSLPPAFPRVAAEAIFLIVIGVIVGVAGWSRLTIVLVMALALAIVWLVEWLAARERAIPQAATAPATAPALDDEPAELAAPVVEPVEEGPEALTILGGPAARGEAEPEPVAEETFAPAAEGPAVHEETAIEPLPETEPKPLLAAEGVPEEPPAEAAAPGEREQEPEAAAVAVTDAAEDEDATGPVAPDDELAAVADELEPAPAVEWPLFEPAPPKRRFRLFRRRSQQSEPEPEPEPELEAHAVAADDEIAQETVPEGTGLPEHDAAAEPEPEPEEELAAALAGAIDAEEPARLEADADIEPPAVGLAADVEEAGADPDEEAPRVDPWEQAAELPAVGEEDDAGPAAEAADEPEARDGESHGRFRWFRRRPLAAAVDAAEPEPEAAAAEVVADDAVDAAAGDEPGPPEDRFDPPDEEPDPPEDEPEPSADDPEPPAAEAVELDAAEVEPEDEEPGELPVELLAEQAAAALERSRARRRRQPRRARRR